MITLLTLLISFAPAWGAGPNADALVAKAEALTRGKSFAGELAMEVDHGSTKRKLRLKLWTEGNDHAMTKVLEPIKDRDVGNLRLELNLWQYLPNVDRIVKIPASMMLQSWMGSDFTNDDLMKTSDMGRDYTHKILGEEKQGGFDAYKIECMPKPTAPVVWGKVVEWVRKKDAVPLKREFYSESGELLKVMEGSEIKSFGSHAIPTHLVMRNLNQKGNSTSLDYVKVEYDQPIDPKVFTQQFLRSTSR